MSVSFENLVVRSMADVLLEQTKEAMSQPMQPRQPGKMEKYLPWYGTAGGGTLGHHFGKKLVPKKYKFLGALTGTLAGTALGLHGGKAIGKRLDRSKTAAKEEKPPHPGVTLAKSLAGFGTGTALGYLGMKGVDRLLRAGGGQGLPQHTALKALPIVTGLGGLAYTQMQNKTLKKMRENHLKRQEMKRGGQST